MIVSFDRAGGAGRHRSDDLSRCHGRHRRGDGAEQDLHGHQVEVAAAEGHVLACAADLSA